MLTAEVATQQLVSVSETLCLPDDVEVDWSQSGTSLQQERKRANAALKQKLWAYVRYHGL